MGSGSSSKKKYSTDAGEAPTPEVEEASKRVAAEAAAEAAKENDSETGSPKKQTSSGRASFRSPSKDDASGRDPSKEEASRRHGRGSEERSGSKEQHHSRDDASGRHGRSSDDRHPSKDEVSDDGKSDDNSKKSRRKHGHRAKIEEPRSEEDHESDEDHGRKGSKRSSKEMEGSPPSPQITPEGGELLAIADDAQAYRGAEMMRQVSTESSQSGGSKKRSLVVSTSLVEAGKSSIAIPRNDEIASRSPSKQSKVNSALPERQLSNMSTGSTSEEARALRRQSIRAHRMSFLQTDPSDPDSPVSPAKSHRSHHSHNSRSSSKYSVTSPTSPGSYDDYSDGGTRRGSRRSVSEADPSSPMHRHHDEHHDESSPSSPTSPSRRRHHEPRGSILGAESLAILHQHNREAKQARDVPDEALCGFLIGDRVTLKGGPDEHGPWEKLGDGTVIEKGSKRGFMKVHFEKSGDVFTIKASNLGNLTDPSRSGSHMVPDKGNGVITRKSLVTEEMEGPREDAFVSGDWVSLSGGGEGVVVQEGTKQGTILVRFGDLGIRSVDAKQLTKKKCPEAKKEAEAQKAREVAETKGRFTLSLSEAGAGFDEKKAGADDREAREMEKAKEAEDLEKAQEGKLEDPNLGLKAGDYVVCTDDDNPMWEDIGIGCIRSNGPKEGTLQVQFESGGDHWVMYAYQLKKVTAPDRRFRRCGQKAIPESLQGKARLKDLMKEGLVEERKGSKDRTGSKQQVDTEGRAGSKEKVDERAGSKTVEPKTSTKADTRVGSKMSVASKK